MAKVPAGACGGCDIILEALSSLDYLQLHLTQKFPLLTRVLLLYTFSPVYVVERTQLNPVLGLPYIYLVGGGGCMGWDPWGTQGKGP